MSARYEFVVGAANRNRDYGHPVVVYAESYPSAVLKAKRLLGYEANPEDAKAWLVRIEEAP